ncbi:ATP-dependent helicase HrpA [Antricoccus suffuscus]|uniref:ATP-dependent helicase HrpA n=1 Tax=Antricoccus suffuscus TaxID=1629062 RepID=A0A2T0Z0L2_9ACTN|nr:ATP-dependent helicase HrpA [Antricoccus suffuscus]
MPGIKYVVDAGTARISRYSAQTKVQRLPIEPISQASANQRAGRCGRTSDGICIRLYAEDDFDARPEFTDPEITRTNLASVILQMAAIGLGEIERFPFVQAPDSRNIADGIALLHELAAIKPDTKRRVSLTEVGRKLAALPIDPRLARMIVEAQKRSCLREVLVIAAAMSIQDPRERPVEAEESAKAKHARFRDKKSDFMSYLNLWRYLREQQKELSSNQFRRLCKSEYINYLRVREWQDLVSQLKQVCATVGIHLPSTDGDEEQVHRALLSGLLSHVGMQDAANKREYVGARNARFAIFPGSSVFKSSPSWIMAGELVDTSRLWARDVARIEPEWAEELAGHLVKRAYSEPHWERKRASVVAYEKVTLYGVPIVARRKVNYGRIDPELSRELFIRQALVEGDWDTRHSFFHHNAAKINEVADLEDKSRRRDILVDDETLFDFYDSKIPADVISGRHFDAWWKKVRTDSPQLLEATTDDLIRSGADAPSATDFPDVWTDGRRPLELSYTFDPAAIARTASDDPDGISIDIPVVALHEAYASEFEWLVPGRREELIIAMIRTLPKPVRRLVVPAPDRARQVLPRLSPGNEPLQPALARELRALTGAAIDESDFNPTKLPDHLRMTFRIVDESGRTLAQGKDLDKLKDQLAPKQRQEIASQSQDIERTGITAWDFGDLPATYDIRSGGVTTTGFPTLVTEGTTLALRVVTSAAQQREDLRTSVRWLLLRELPSIASRVLRTLNSTERIALTQTSHPSASALYDDCAAAAIDLIVAKSGPLPMTRQGYEKLREVAQGAIVATMSRTMRELATTLTARAEALLLLDEIRHESFADVRADIASQLDFLFGPSFVTRHGVGRLRDLGRYAKAVAVRLDRIKAHRDTDRRGMLVIHDVLQEYAELVAEFPSDEPLPPALTDIRWMIEELRVGTFAQSVPTAYTVSVKRIHKAMDDL